MFAPEQETSFGHRNAYAHPLPPGGAAIHPPPYPEYPPSFLTAPPPQYFSNAPSPFMMTSGGPQMVESLKYYQTFLKGSPKALGIVLIVTAALQVALGIALVFVVLASSLRSGIPFWGPVMYIGAGSVSIAAQSRPNPRLIQKSRSLNILSALISVVGMILCCIDLAALSFLLCENTGDGYGHITSCWFNLDGPFAVTSILLITNLLIFCVSISITVFAFRSLNQVSGAQQVLVIQNTVTLPMSSPTSPGFVPTLSPAYFQPPPPYLKDSNPGELRIQTIG